MFILRKKSSGNKYTFISIILILVVIYTVRLTLPQKEIVYPGIVHYNGRSYQYTETVKGWPIMYARKKPVSSEGFIVLKRRGTDILEEIYIYEGRMKYRRYAALKE